MSNTKRICVHARWSDQCPTCKPYTLSDSELNTLLYGEFKPDERQIALYDRLVKYYKDTPDSMSNRSALPHWKLFKQWCAERGYTQDEINTAKKQTAHLAI